MTTVALSVAQRRALRIYLKERLQGELEDFTITMIYRERVFFRGAVGDTVTASYVPLYMLDKIIEAGERLRRARRTA